MTYKSTTTGRVVIVGSRLGWFGALKGIPVAGYHSGMFASFVIETSLTCISDHNYSGKVKCNVTYA